jgi:hypothetical protein
MKRTVEEIAADPALADTLRALAALRSGDRR